MKAMRTSRRFTAHVMLVFAVVCLLAIQGFGIGGLRSAMSGTAIDGLHVTAQGAVISCANAVKSGAPTHGEHDQDQCCAFCAAQPDKTSFLAILAVARIIGFLSPEKSSLPPIWSDQPYLALHPLGWGSSWASTAPPRA